MTNGGDAAETTFRMVLNGSEVLIKLTGIAAKNIAAYLFAVLSEKEKVKGRTLLIDTLLKKNEPIITFTIRKEDFKDFKTHARKHGILYHDIPDNYSTSDKLVEIMVPESHAPRANRLVKNLKLSSVGEVTKIMAEADAQRAKAVGNDLDNGGKGREDIPDIGVEERDAAEKWADDLFAPIKKEEVQEVNPTAAKTGKSLPSEPISEKQSKEGTFDPALVRRPSVRAEIADIKKKQSQEKKVNVQDKGTPTKVSNLAKKPKVNKER